MTQPEYLMTPAEVREYRRLRALALSVGSRARAAVDSGEWGDRMLAWMGAWSRVEPAPSPADPEGAAAWKLGYNAADALIGPKASETLRWIKTEAGACAGRAKQTVVTPAGRVFVAVREWDGYSTFSPDEAESFARVILAQVEACRAEAAEVSL